MCIQKLSEEELLAKYREAAEKGEREIVELLFKERKNNFEMKPEAFLLIALEYNYLNIIQVLLNAPCNVSNCLGLVALHFASLSGHRDIVALLLNYTRDQCQCS